MQTISINPAIRIRPPSNLTNNKWQVEDFNSRKKFSIPEIGVSILLYCLSPQKKEKVINEACKFYSLPYENIESLVDSLTERKLINSQIQLNETSVNSELFLKNYSAWKKNNWGSAAEYHFFTYNYPFLDYSEGASGWQIADKRMQDYSEKEPDTNRVKIYPDEFKRIDFSWPLNEESTDLQKINSENSKRLDLENLSVLATVAFAKTKNASIRWKGIPLIRRTSPSGGSRHPTEGYLIAFDIKGINMGLYHIQSDPCCLAQLNIEINNKFSNIFPEFYKEDGRFPAAIIILTSVFERNMFRYREPRTFRTIHMDAGHILGTIELISRYLNIQSKVSHQFDERTIEKLIGIDGLSEGAITSIGIFNS